MKAFKSISMVTYPLDTVWTTIRDRLPELAHYLSDIEDITVEARTQGPDGTIDLVNIWKANPPIPSMISSVVDKSKLVWTDRAEWKPGNYECHWRIEPNFFTERIKCSGVTRYETAMGGRGTRITFEGAFDLTDRHFPGVPSIFEGAIATGIESFVSTLIPKNFRKLTQAVSTFLGSQS